MVKEPSKEKRRRDRTEEDPEQARNREKARKILQNFDFSKLFNPVAPRVAKSVQVRAKQEPAQIKAEFENLQQINFKDLREDLKGDLREGLRAADGQSE